MELDHSGIAARVPHTGRMYLLDCVLHWDERSIRCSAVSHRDADNPLRDAGGLSTLAAIEYAASCNGAQRTFTWRVNNGPASIFLGDYLT